MQKTLTSAPRRNLKSFLGFDVVRDLTNCPADIAILGIPFGDPYGIDEVTNDQSNAPTAVRQASVKASDRLDRWDFDLGGTLFDGRPIRAVDCGDVLGDPRDLTTHYKNAEAMVRNIRKAGALPLVIGGDHGIPIPVLRAFDDDAPITVVQLDAHLDWIDEFDGVREGYSSPMRRASEMDHVEGMFQIGLRSQGSAKVAEVEAARAYGSRLITAEEVHDSGMEAVLAQIPDGGRYYLTIDADGLDPSVMPAVAGPAPGGLTYLQSCKLIRGLVAKGRVVGMDICEITPQADVNEITSVTAGRLMINLIGAAVRAGYFD
ncbi:MAG: agmatinase [Albidovulum sp.]